MSRIATGVGVHRATLYRHFPTRDLLVARLAEAATVEGRAIISGITTEQPTIDEIRHLADAISEFGGRYSFLIGTTAVLNAGEDPIGLIPLMVRWQNARLIRTDLTARWLAASFTALAITLHDTRGLPGADVGAADRSSVLFTTFADGALADNEAPE